MPHFHNQISNYIIYIKSQTFSFFRNRIILQWEKSAFLAKFKYIELKLYNELVVIYTSTKSNNIIKMKKNYDMKQKYIPIKKFESISLYNYKWLCNFINFWLCIRKRRFLIIAPFSFDIIFISKNRINKDNIQVSFFLKKLIHC
jgi:hypothetical protein